MGIPVIRQTLDGIVGIETYRAFPGEACHHVIHTVPLLMTPGDIFRGLPRAAAERTQL